MYESANIPSPNMFNPGNHVNGLRIEKLLMFETGTYSPQQRRPYVASASPGSISLIQERIAEGHNRITPQTFAGIGMSFVQPSVQSIGEAQIAEGWGTRRFRFLMHVSYTRGSAMGQRVHEIISGWTDRSDLSFGLRVDPNLIFTINSVVHLREITENYGAGAITSFQVANNDTLLGRPDFQIAGLASPTREIVMRPMDVFTNMSLQGANFGTPDVTDSRTTLTNKAIKSSRVNNNPNQYLSRLVDNYVNGATYANHQMSQGQQEFDPMTNSHRAPVNSLAQAKSYAREHSVHQDTVLRLLQQHTMADEPGVTFTYAALCSIDPTIDSRKIVNHSMQAQQVQLHDPSMSQVWTDTTEETHSATILSLAIPAIMSDLGLTRLDFLCTNHSINGMFVLQPSKALAFSEHMDCTSRCQMFQTRLVEEVLRDIALEHMGGRPVAIDVQCDLVGETAISISLDGKSPVQYVSPSFCDSLLTPVTTNNVNMLTQLSSNMNTLFNQLDGIAQPTTATNISIGPGAMDGGYNI